MAGEKMIPHPSIVRDEVLRGPDFRACDATAPPRRPQFRFLNLFGRSTRQILHHAEKTWHGVFRQVLFGEGEDFRQIRIGAAQHDRGRDILIRVLRYQAVDGRFGDIRVLVEDAFDLPGGDIFAPAPDRILAAFLEIKIAFLRAW